MDNLNTKYTCTCCGAEVSLEQLNDFNCPKCGNIIEKAQKEYEEKYGKNEDKENDSLYKGVPGYSQSTYKKDINKTFIELSLSLIGVGLSVISLFFNNWLGLILFCVYLLLKDVFFLNLSKYEENIVKNFRKK